MAAKAEIFQHGGDGAGMRTGHAAFSCLSFLGRLGATSRESWAKRKSINGPEPKTNPLAADFAFHTPVDGSVRAPKLGAFAL